METLVKTKKKLTLTDLEVTSFSTSKAIRNIMFITNDVNCAEFGGIYAAQTGNTQCKANGGCIDATNAVCNTMQDACNASANCQSIGCPDVTFDCTVGCSAVC